MNRSVIRPAAIMMSLFLIASAVTAVIALSSWVDRDRSNRDIVPEPVVVARWQTPGDPIASEAAVFRTRPGLLSIDPTQGSRRAAHPRTLRTFRALRSYPGAPPRIPHGLTPDELQSGGCKTCHERGGFSQRFGAYVPVTPHPEMSACLQCHVGDSKLMAISLPNTDPSVRCAQCHSTGGAMGWSDSAIDWKPAAWPVLARNTPGRTPPPVPHSLELRGNCLACHAAPAAVDAIRTRHPERANCRQCHVPVNAGRGEFIRTAPRTANRPGGGS